MASPTDAQDWLERTIGDALIGVPDDWEGPEPLPKANAVRYTDVAASRSVVVRTGRWRGADAPEPDRVKQFADLNRASLFHQGLDVEGVDDLPVRRSDRGIHVLGQVGFGWMGPREDGNYTVFYALHCHFPGQELLTIQVSDTGNGATVADVGAWALAFLEQFRGFLPRSARGRWS